MQWTHHNTEPTREGEAEEEDRDESNNLRRVQGR